jgi:hypothetical protein
MRKFKELKVWQKAHQFTLDVYRHSKGFPPDERFGLTVQLRKAAASVPSTIAEGCGRSGEREPPPLPLGYSPGPTVLCL